jgi:hypothetical protein
MKWQLPFKSKHNHQCKLIKNLFDQAGHRGVFCFIGVSPPFSDHLDLLVHTLNQVPFLVTNNAFFIVQRAPAQPNTGKWSWLWRGLSSSGIEPAGLAVCIFSYFLLRFSSSAECHKFTFAEYLFNHLRHFHYQCARTMCRITITHSIRHGIYP